VSLLDHNGLDWSFSSNSHRYLVLFFYPKASTSGCTKEAAAFEEMADQFRQLGAGIVGVSRDTVAKQSQFAQSLSLSYPLLSDDAGALCEHFSVWQEKSMYGRKYMGIDRSTFILNDVGEVVAEWRAVKVPGHANDVFQRLATLVG